MGCQGGAGDRQDTGADEAEDGSMTTHVLNSFLCFGYGSAMSADPRLCPASSDEIADSLLPSATMAASG